MTSRCRTSAPRVVRNHSVTGYYASCKARSSRRRETSVFGALGATMSRLATFFFFGTFLSPSRDEQNLHALAS